MTHKVVTAMDYFEPDRLSPVKCLESAAEKLPEDYPSKKGGDNSEPYEACHKSVWQKKTSIPEKLEFAKKEVAGKNSGSHSRGRKLQDLER